MVTREQAVELFHKYNKSESLWHHALCVEAVMRAFAAEAGEDVDYWGIVGLLHDIDWEMFPDQHCRKAPELLAEIGMPDDMVHAICSHGWGLVSDVEPQRQMEKILYAVDELTGLVYATALMRPERMAGMSVKSVKKKWSSKSFAAGVNREVIEKGAQMADVTKEHLIEVTIQALTSISDQIGLCGTTTPIMWATSR